MSARKERGEEEIINRKEEGKGERTDNQSIKGGNNIKRE